MKICSSCNRDISHSPCYDHILCLSDTSIGPKNEWVVDVLIMPLLEEDHYFCGFSCLKTWIEKKV